MAVKGEFLDIDIMNARFEGLQQGLDNVVRALSAKRIPVRQYYKPLLKKEVREKEFTLEELIKIHGGEGVVIEKNL